MWTINKETGEVKNPDGNVVATVEGDVRIPQAVQKVAEEAFRDENMDDLTTDDIADYAVAWMGGVEYE